MGKADCGSVDGGTIPRTYEMTFLRKSKVSRKEGPLPIPGLDFPNNRRVADFDLNCYPFVAGGED